MSTNMKISTPAEFATFVWWKVHLPDDAEIWLNPTLYSGSVNMKPAKFSASYLFPLRGPVLEKFSY